MSAAGSTPIARAFFPVSFPSRTRRARASLHGLLDRALQRPGAESRVVAPFCEPFANLRRPGEPEAAARQRRGEPIQLDVHDPFDLGFLKPVKDDDVVDAVRNSGRKWRARASVTFAFISSSSRPASSMIHSDSDVGRHDDDGVFEIDHAALGVGQPAVVEDLQKDVEDLGMCLFDFVEENNGIRAVPYQFGEPPPSS